MRILTLLELFERFLGALSRLCVVFAGVCLVFLTVIFGWLVFGRYVLNATPTWVEQAALLLVAAITFIGAAAGVHENRHLSVTFFRDWAPRKFGVAFVWISHGLTATFGLVMLVESYALAKFKWAVSIPLIELPEGLRAVPITVCGGLIFLFSLGHIARLARGEKPDDAIPR